jgi:type I restriction enzyme, S subunit
MTSLATPKEAPGVRQGWIQTTVGAECDVMAGFGFPERLQGKLSGDLPFYKVGDISEAWKAGSTFLTESRNYVSHAECRELRAKPLPANATVFAKIGAAIALNRRAMLSEPSLVDNNVMGLYPRSDALDPKFLFHFACTLRLDELSRATTVPSVRKSDIEAIALPRPPLDEQKRIVTEIEKQLTRLDAGVAALRRVQANLKRYRAAVLKAACEGRLVPTEAELARKEGRTFETGTALLARILEERRDNWQGRGRYREPAAATSQWPLPDGWTWASVEQISTKVVDGVHKKPAYVPSGIPFVTVRNLTAGPGISFERLRYITPEDHTEFIKRADPERGDVLVSKDGTLGVVRVVRTDEVFSIFVSVAMVKPVLRGMADFIGLALSAPQVQAQMVPKGSGLQHIHLEDLREDCVPLPPLAEQVRIVTEVDRRLSVIDELEATAAANLQRATRLRQSVLHEAFGGSTTGAGAEGRDNREAQA